MRCLSSNLEAGGRHDLLFGISLDAPDESHRQDEAYEAFGYLHSYETAFRYDGPGLRFVLFVSGCLLRCSYCHNPDTWHLKDGASIPAQQVIDRLAGFASQSENSGRPDALWQAARLCRLWAGAYVTL